MRMRIQSTLATLLAIGMVGLVQAQAIEAPAIDNRDQPAGETQLQDPPRDAAEPAPERREANFRGQPGANQQANEELINYLAAKLMIMNKCEVQMADLAMNQASSNEVKEFARKIKEDHGKLNEQLVQAMPGLKSVDSPQLGNNDRGTPRGEINSQPNVTDRTRPAERNIAERGINNRDASGTATDRTAANTGNRDAFLDGGAQTLTEITRRAAENAHQSTRQMLTEKQGKKFDICYVNQQIGAHTWMLAELQAIQDIGPQEFTSIVQQAERDVEQHLNSAKELAKSLESESDSRTDSSTTTSRQPAGQR